VLSPIARSAFILLALSCLGYGRAAACAGLSPASAPAPQIFVTSERAVIIWDEAHKTEHFIRQANMLTQDSNIGFLVPTPETPDLAEVDPQIFDMAAFLSQPRKISPVNYHGPWALVSPFVISSFLNLNRVNPATFLASLRGFGAPPARPGVVAQQDVAGYHVTTLAAEDEQALSVWLAANGYLSTPELRAWLKPYIANKWKINAFKLVKSEDDPLLSTAAIRLSFHIDRPFYPYSEPSDRQLPGAASPNGRALEVTILSNQRMTGALADNNPWPERLEFAGSSAPPSNLKTWNPNQWLHFAQLDNRGQNVVLPTKITTFIDQSNPRPGTADLYFSPDSDQSVFRGDVVDLNAPPVDEYVFSYSFPDIAALLALFILTAVPLYCGWRVLSQDPVDDADHFGTRRFLFRPRPQIMVPRNPWLRLVNGLAGVLAIVLGLYYCIQCILLILGEIASALFGWADLRGTGILIFLGVLVAAGLFAAMSWAVTVCGVNVWRLWSLGVPLPRNNPFYAKGAWQGLMATLSLLAGGIALIAVESLVANFL
jgi:hypothetical protein